jgi:hypothetical protein
MSQDEAVAATEATEADEPVFENRAARRAKGKASSTPRPNAKGAQRIGGRGAVESPRQYGTRRSG